MVHGEHHIPYWIDRRLTGLAGPDYDATISFELPFELGDCPYGKYRISCILRSNGKLALQCHNPQPRPTTTFYDRINVGDRSG